MKLYIDHQLQIRASEKGWPEPPSDPWTGNSTPHQDDIHQEWIDYHDQIQKDKDESLVIESDIYSIWHIIDNLCKRPVDRRPDSFIELPVEVEFLDEMFMSNPPRPTGKRIARLKENKNSGFVMASSANICNNTDQTKEVTASDLPDAKPKSLGHVV